MRTYLAALILSIFIPSMQGQVFPHIDYPHLFNDVQLSSIFPDSKTFPDCTPLISASIVDSVYVQEKKHRGFDLEDFLQTFFIIPVSPESLFKSDTSICIEDHIDKMWNILERNPGNKFGSLLALNYRYIVPGGRFRELYYWDSYFTMLGLAVSDKKELMAGMISNFADLIDRYGFIPNGNRSYYLSRSQPPYFALMLQLIRETHGDEYALQYLPQLEKEYTFWMHGAKELSESNMAINRVVLIDNNTILNRYWDNSPLPRPEAYKEDIELSKISSQPDSILYRNIRAACESGWDFSSRWMSDKENFASIETTNIIPVDLNCLMYTMEITLHDFHGLANNKEKAKLFEKLAVQRKKAINKLLWHKEKGFYADYNFTSKKLNSPHYLSGIFPLFIEIASKNHAKHSVSYLIHTFLESGGVVCSIHETNQQWDFPNGWAPLIYICVKGLYNYEENMVADQITKRWTELNSTVYIDSGKLLEKYNVSNLQSESGGGKYPGQDGFGWTNGIYLKLTEEMNRNKD